MNEREGGGERGREREKEREVERVRERKRKRKRERSRERKRESVVCFAVLFLLSLALSYLPVLESEKMCEKLVVKFVSPQFKNGFRSPTHSLEASSHTPWALFWESSLLIPPPCLVATTAVETVPSTTLHSTRTHSTAQNVWLCCRLCRCQRVCMCLSPPTSLTNPIA